MQKKFVSLSLFFFSSYMYNKRKNILFLIIQWVTSMQQERRPCFSARFDMFPVTSCYLPCVFAGLSGLTIRLHCQHLFFMWLSAPLLDKLYRRLRPPSDCFPLRFDMRPNHETLKTRIKRRLHNLQKYFIN